MARRRPTDDAGGRGTGGSDQDVGSSSEWAADGEGDEPNEQPSGPDDANSDGTSPDGSSEQGSLSENLVFASVDSPRRRFILEALVEEGGAADIDRLVDDVVDIERRTEADDAPEDHAELLEEIYDGDLPELSDIGVVDLDESSGTVELGPYAEELDVDELTPDLE